MTQIALQHPQAIFHPEAVCPRGWHAVSAVHARKSPTKSVMQRGLPMKTLDPKRLAQAGAVSSITGRRRVGLRAVVLLLLGGLVLLGAVVLIALSGAGLRGAHAQTIGEPVCYISAPTLPQTNHLNCIQPRVFIPIAMNAH